MGSFAGHALPGTFFIIFSIWWTSQMMIRYHKDKTRNKFRSSATFPCPIKFAGLTSFPLEAFFKISFSVIGVLGEIIWSYRNDVTVGGIPVGNKQHVTMFSVFGISGLVDLLTQYKSILPPDCDYASMVLALGVEFILFKFHITERSKLGVLLHQNLANTIAVNIIALLIEMKYRKSILAGLSRSYFLLLQGTWFWQVGIILYNPKYHSRWDVNNDDNLILAQLVYAWHIVGCFILMLIINSIIAYCYREKNVKSGDYLNLNILESRPAGELRNTLMSDSESE